MQTLVQRLRVLLRRRRLSEVQEELEHTRPEDIAEALQRLSPEEGLELLRSLKDEAAAEALILTPTETARPILRELSDDTLAHYLDILPMDDAIELREVLGEERFESLLNVIPPEDAREIERLLQFPADSAGRYMTEDFVAVSPDETMGEIIERIRNAEPGEFETVNDLYVLDEDRHLKGVFSLRQAIQAPPEAKARDVMVHDVVTASAEDRAEDVARQIARYGFYAMPILDSRGRMLGIFTVDDAQYVLSQADTEDVLKLGGVSGDAEAYLSLSVWQLARRRLPWLFALFVAETFTGSVLRYYGQSSEGLLQLSPITYFLPLLIGAGGNSGSQVTTTITRALAVGEVTTADVWTVLRREFGTAWLVGGVMGIAGYIRAVTWGTSPELCLVVGLTLPAIVLWATAIGSLLPLGAKRAGLDPAVMSAPFITTFVDATGLIIYFEIARRILGDFGA